MRELRTWKADGPEGRLIWAQVFVQSHVRVGPDAYREYWHGVGEPVLVNTYGINMAEFAKGMLANGDERVEHQKTYKAYVLDPKTTDGVILMNP